LVHRQSFDLPDVVQPIEELSVDGGKVKLRTPLGEECEWKDYKAIATHPIAGCTLDTFLKLGRVLKHHSRQPEHNQTTELNSAAVDRSGKICIDI
jgi:hypothetical protein